MRSQESALPHPSPAFAPPFAAPRHTPLWDGQGIAAATPVATPYGQIPAERLQPGGQVLGPGGALLTLTEVRRLSLPGALFRRLGLDAPVEIAAGALGFGMPSGPLVLGPAQRIRLAGGWIAADLLADGRAIRTTDGGGPMIALRHAGEGPFLAAGTPLGAPASADQDGLADIAATVATLRRLADGSGVPTRDLDGFVDHADHFGVAGWAIDRALPDRVVPLEILAGDAVIALAVADKPRPDVAADRPGGRARHGFAVRFAAPLPAGRSWMITVRRAGGGPALGGTLVLLDAAGASSEAFDLALAAIADGAAGAEFLARLMDAGVAARRR
jgi:hypothetical protein